MHSSKDSIIVKIEDSNPRPKQLCPAGALDLVTKLCAPSAGFAPTLLLLPLATTRTSPLNSSTPIATTLTAATTATPTTATTKAPTPATTTTAATTSTTYTSAPTTTSAATSTTPTTLALAAVALPTSRSSPDILSTKYVNSSRRGVGGNTPQRRGCEECHERHLQRLL
ncbi:unnamed protein product [Closterium sp. NIES-54]